MSSTAMNPLFFDSTVSHGTNIKTRFELTHVILRDHEELVLILETGNKKEIIKLMPKDNKIYFGSIWLPHRAFVSYQYVIQNQDQILFYSDKRRAQAVYILSDKWQGTESEGEWLDQPPYSVTFHSDEDVVKKTKTKDDVLGELINKWDL